MLTAIKKKGTSLLIPFISCGTFYAVSFDAFDKYIFDAFHAGYWFLCSLFICWVLFIPVLKLAERLPKKKLYIGFNIRIILELTILMLPFFIGKLFDDSLQEYLLLGMSLSYYRFLVLGYFIGEFIRTTSKILYLIKKDNYSTVSALGFILFIILSVCYFKHFEWIGSIPFTIMQISLCITFLGFVYCYKLCIKDKISEYIEYLGRKSLIIYCFHYFIIYYIKLDEVSVLNNCSEGILFVFASILSFIIITLTLLIAIPIEKNKYLSLIFLGKGII